MLSLNFDRNHITMYGRYKGRLTYTWLGIHEAIEHNIWI